MAAAAEDGYGILISGDEMPTIEDNILEIHALLSRTGIVLFVCFLYILVALICARCC